MSVDESGTAFDGRMNSSVWTSHISGAWMHGFCQIWGQAIAEFGNAYRSEDRSGSWHDKEGCTSLCQLLYNNVQQLTQSLQGQLFHFTSTICWAENKATWCLWALQTNRMGVPQKITSTKMMKEGQGCDRELAIIFYTSLGLTWSKRTWPRPHTIRSSLEKLSVPSLQPIISM